MAFRHRDRAGPDPPQKKGDAIVDVKDEHPRETSLETLAKLKGVVRPHGSVTAGSPSGVNDGACALLLGDESAATRRGLVPEARVVAMASAGVPHASWAWARPPQRARYSRWPD